MSETKKVDKRPKERHKFYYLQQIYFLYLTFLPGLAFYGVMDYSFANGTMEVDDIFTVNLVIGGLFTTVFYSVITEIIKVPERKFAALLMILDAPLLLLGLKLFGADISIFQFLTLDYFIEAVGFLACLGIIAVFPKLNKRRGMPFDKNLSIGGLMLCGVMGLFIWSLYYPHGFILVEFLRNQSLFNQIPVYVAMISTVFMYLRYMGSGFSRDNTFWILVTMGSWFFGIASAYGVVSLFY